MTEHFTQADMKELAGDVGISFYPRHFSDKNLTDLCNAAVNHKLQELGAQEPVGSQDTTSLQSADALGLSEMDALAEGMANCQCGPNETAWRYMTERQKDELRAYAEFALVKCGRMRAEPGDIGFGVQPFDATVFAAPVAPAQPQIRVVDGNGNDAAPRQEQKGGAM